MILRLTTVPENVRSALECGGLTPPSPLGLHAGNTLRRRQAAALQGAFGTAISMVARNLALKTRRVRDVSALLRQVATAQDSNPRPRGPCPAPRADPCAL